MGGRDLSDIRNAPVVNIRKGKASSVKYYYSSYDMTQRETFQVLTGLP